MCDQPNSALIVTTDGAVRRVDRCMRALVQFLNDAGLRTYDSCCGHGTRWGHVTIRVSDAPRARALGFRVCEDTGDSAPIYPFTGRLGDDVNIVLPPVVNAELPAVRAERHADAPAS